LFHSILKRRSDKSKRLIGRCKDTFMSYQNFRLLIAEHRS
jgi:hypothetical protein